MSDSTEAKQKTAHTPGHSQAVLDIIREAIELLAERSYGSPARSPAHNARLVLERAMLAAAAPNAADAAATPCACGDLRALLIEAIDYMEKQITWPVERERIIREGRAAALSASPLPAPDTAAERDRLREINAELVRACDKIFSLVSYINIHGVGEQPEPVEGCPQLVRVSVEGLNEIIQLIGTTADSALSKVEGK